jgi:sigma-B regulation protein RsbU (phosphoserine phosphatase)
LFPRAPDRHNGAMLSRSFQLERWRALAAFEGDPAAALRELAQHLRERLPEVTVALLLVRGQASGSCRLAGLIGPDGAEHFPNIDPYGQRTVLPLFEDALSARLTALETPHVLDLPPGACAAPLGQTLLSPAALMALPMIPSGRLDHWVVLGSADRGRFHGEDLERLWLEAGHAVSLISRALTVRNIERVSRHRHDEIEGLAEIQRLLQPDQPEIRGLEYALHWQPAETAAGDYYDLMPLTQFAENEYPSDAGDIWAVLIGDVSGHGAASAMEAVQFDAILRTYKGDEEPRGPAGALTYANRHFFSRRQRRHFMTVFAATSRPERGELTYVCAGHPAAYVKRGASLRALGNGDDGGIPLGILREHRWENHVAAFEPGDTLVLYTDGVVEARDAQGRMFGQERIEALLREGNGDPETIKSRLCDALFEHQGGRVGQDDQTLIVLHQT